jgi:hypothetical protein
MMDDETPTAIKALTQRVEDAELRCKILAYALRGAISQLNPNAGVTARRMANTAVLAHCTAGQLGRRLAILVDLFPNARDGSEDHKFIPPSRDE